MRKLKPIILFLVALILFIASEMSLVYVGLVKVYFIFFIPVFVSSSAIAIVPLLFFLIPIAFFFYSGHQKEEFGRVREQEKAEEPPQAKREVKYGGLVMIGPVPIIFGKGISNRILLILAILMVILIISWFIFTK